MKRSTFWKIILIAAAFGALNAIMVLGLGKWANIAVYHEILIWIYPAARMLMLTQTGGPTFVAITVILSILTNAALYFIAAAAITGLITKANGGLTD